MLNVSKPNLLCIPGHTPIPPNIQNTMNHPMINHRGNEAYRLLNGIKKDIKSIFGTEQDVVSVTGSGTSAMEAAVVNTTGVFGLRFLEICNSYVNKVHYIKAEWGSAFEPEIVIDFIKKIRALKQYLLLFVKHLLAF